jgi:hypothetical protein
MSLPEEKISPLRRWMSLVYSCTSTKSWITFWPSLTQIHYLYGTDPNPSIYSFENDDSGLAVKFYSGITKV